jgi:pyruvate,water dikinase
MPHVPTCPRSQKLEPLGINIPDGFAVTASAYKKTLNQANAWDELRQILKDLDQHSDSTAVAQAGIRAREIVYAAAMPKDVEAGLREAWRALKASSGTGEDLSVAVRSSATAEDLPSASFAGQHDTYLNVTG